MKSTFSGLQFRRWEYGSISIRVAVVAFQNRKITRNSEREKIDLIAVQGHPRSSILVSIESPGATYKTMYMLHVSVLVRWAKLAGENNERPDLKLRVARRLDERFADRQHHARPHSILVSIRTRAVATGNQTTPRWHHRDVTVHVEGHVTATDAERHLVKDSWRQLDGQVDGGGGGGRRWGVDRVLSDVDTTSTNLHADVHVPVLIRSPTCINLHARGTRQIAQLYDTIL